jgi:hypothetical protein
MGNIIVKPSDQTQTVLDDSTGIGKIIKKWALDNYDVKHKDLLLKRACCTRQQNMPITLPYIDADGNVNNDESNVIYINLFKNSNELVSTCKTILGDDKYTYDYYKDGYRASDTCKSVYLDIGNVNGLCTEIKNKRKLLYDDEFMIAYGPDKLGSAYPDCNCINSVYRSYKQQVNDINITPELLASLDPLCTNNVGNTFKSAYIEPPTCINLIDGSINNNGSFNVHQSCMDNKNQPASQPKLTQSSDITKPVNDLPINSSTNTTNKLFMIGGGMVVLVVLLFILYKIAFVK